MNIFNALKYPISRNPTEEEFRAIPRPMYEAWVYYVAESECRRLPNSGFSFYNHPQFNISYLKLIDPALAEEYLQNLRNRILTIEE